MKNLNIEASLREWARKMVCQFDWLTVKFEYNEVRGRYLVSYYPTDEIDMSDDFCNEAVAFEDRINMLYLDDAPLFCDGERLFHLSSKAETISKPSWCDFFKSSPISHITFLGGTTETVNDKAKENEYALAA